MLATYAKYSISNFSNPRGIISLNSLTKTIIVTFPLHLLSQLSLTQSPFSPKSFDPSTSTSTLLPSLTTSSITSLKPPFTSLICPISKHGTALTVHAPSVSKKLALPNLICVKLSIFILFALDLSFLNEPLNHSGRDK